MKRSLRHIASLGLALPLAGNAVTLSHNGIGQALVYPYYTVNKSQDTLISVTNASGIGKAVEVRFLEGYNGREVLAFVVFLSPHDVWTAAISQTADDGGAILHTSDRSCTFPAIGSEGVAFTSFNYDGGSSLPADSGPQDITRTREGSIDIIAGGDIVPGTATDDAIEHVQNGNPGQGTPPGCATLSESNLGSDLVAPTGGIFGSASIVNVGQGTLFAYDADALADFTTTSLFDIPNGVAPTLDRANSSDGTPGVTANVVDDNGQPMTLHYALGIDAVSAVFMSAALRNEFLTDGSLGANTDWIVTLPTKRFYVDDTIYASAPRLPFAESFHSPGVSFVTWAGLVYDREEGVDATYPLGGCGFICPGDMTREFGYEVNTLSFLPSGTADGTPSGVFGSKLTSNFNAYGADGTGTMGTSGWVSVDVYSADGGHWLPGGTLANGSAVTLLGLPVTGFMAYNIINAQAQPGMLANYGGTFPMRGAFACSDDAGLCAPINNGAGG